MTTRVLTGTYASGYALSGNYDTLSIASTGLVQGSGVSIASGLPFIVTIENDGRVAPGR